MSANQDHVSMMRHYIRCPSAWVKDWIGVSPDQWQQECLDNCLNVNRYAIAGCTGAGKSTFLAWLILYYLCTRPFSRVLVTATKFEQIKDQLWPECKKWIHHSGKLSQVLRWTPTKILYNHPDADPRWCAMQRVARTTKSVGGDGKQAEGLGGIHEDHLLVIIDEASGVEPENFEAAEGNLTGIDNHLVVTGNPLRSSGRFWQIFNTPTFQKQWARKHVSYLEAPRVDRAQAERLIEVYGIDSPTVQARVFGRFPAKSAVDTCFASDDIRGAMDRWTAWKHGSLEHHPSEWEPVQIGVDCARFGSDDTVWVVRKGLVAVHYEMEGRTSATQVAGKVIELAQKWAVPDETCLQPWKKVVVCCDETGLGGGIVDILNDSGMENIIGVNFGCAAVDSERFSNLPSELWLSDFAGQLTRICIPDDESLYNQLASRRFSYESGQVQKRKIESKDTMKRRGLSSPDFAEAVILAFMDTDMHSGFSEVRLLSL